MRTTFLGLFLTLVSVPAWAVDIQERCSEDQLTTSQLASQRNQWALGCHLINKIDYDCAQANGYYWTFISTTGGANRAPTLLTSSCEGYKKFTMCPAGCFAAKERLLFDGTYLTPEQAYTTGKTTVTTLATDASLSRLRFAEETIGTFVRGAEHKDLVHITLQSGDAISVTDNHPMVQGDGQLRAAKDVVAGMVLLTTRGPQAVAQVTAEPYVGTVWNVRPVKAAPKANIDVAEGFLTGSIRYQNEWANDAARLLLRQSIDISGL